MEVKLSKKETDLLQACTYGDVATVEKLLNEGENADLISNNDGDTLLMTAVWYNKEFVVDALLEHGANVNAKNNRGETALSKACTFRNNYKVVKELIDSGASLNNISEKEMRCIIENLSDYSITKILTAVLNRDSENIGGYLDEYFNKINKVTGLNKMSVLEYKRYIPQFYQVNNYIESLKNSKEVKKLREETKILKEKIENATKVGSTSKKLDQIKQKVHRNKMILKKLRTFEMDTKDMLNVKILRPIYCRKQSIDFELK